MNWVVGTTPTTLMNIHENDINICIFNRGITLLSDEIVNLRKQDFEFTASGDIVTILTTLAHSRHLNNHPLIKEDIEDLLKLFKEVTGVKSFRLLLATINDNMCTKFHTDINDLRMLCTYSGPGTLWLTEDNINKEVQDCCDSDNSNAVDENKIRQANTGSVLILKGAIYPRENAKAVLHRSPAIEESGEKRLLLRIDTNELSGFRDRKNKYTKATKIV